MSLTIFPFDNLVSPSKNTLYQRFHAVETNILGKRGLYCRIEKAHITAMRIPSNLQS
jgi:hypothetical protein